MKHQKELDILLNRIKALGEIFGDGESQYKHIDHTLAAIAVGNGYQNIVDYYSIGVCVPEHELLKEKNIQDYKFDKHSHKIFASVINDYIDFTWEKIEKIFIENKIDKNEFIDYYKIPNLYIKWAEELKKEQQYE